MSRGRPDGDYGPRGPASRNDPAADEDYDWIKYLGEGRGAAPGAGAQPPPARPLPSRPVASQRKPQQRKPQPESRPGRDSGARLAPRRADRAGDVGDYGRPLYEGLTNSQPIPVPPVSLPPVSPPPPGQPPPSRLPLRRPASEPWLDSQEYARPLYPPDDTGSFRTRRGRQLPPPPVRPRPAILPDDTDPQTSPGGRRLELPRRAASPGPRPALPGPRPALPGRPREDERARRDDGWVTASDTRPRAAPRGPEAAPPRASRAAADLAKSAKALRGPHQRVPARRPKQAVAAKPRGKAGSTGSLMKAVLRLPRRVMIVSGFLVVAVLAGAAYYLLAPQPAHVVSTPSQLGAFTKAPSVDSVTARALRNKIVAGAAGEVKNVVAAVYEQTTGPGTSQGPQIVVFIGGNLTGGGSASGFIGDLVTQLHGSFTTNAGTLAGQAACAPGSNGGLAECAWADSDTFGVVVSATLSAGGLADEMRVMRPLVERAAK